MNNIFGVFFICKVGKKEKTRYITLENVKPYNKSLINEIMKSKDEKNRLYEIQRKVVMMRRFQYGKKFNEEGFLNDEEGEDFFDKINKIQL